MRLSVSVSDTNVNKTQIRSGNHHQIWIDSDVFILFDSDREMLDWVTDLYSKTLAAVGDEVIGNGPETENEENNA